MIGHSYALKHLLHTDKVVLSNNLSENQIIHKFFGNFQNEKK